MRLVLIGHGRMGRLVEQHAASHDCEIAGIVRSHSASDLEFLDFGKVDVVIDFSHAAGVCANETYWLSGACLLRLAVLTAVMICRVMHSSAKLRKLDSRS